MADYSRLWQTVAGCMVGCGRLCMLWCWCWQPQPGQAGGLGQCRLAPSSMNLERSDNSSVAQQTFNCGLERPDPALPPPDIWHYSIICDNDYSNLDSSIQLQLIELVRTVTSRGRCARNQEEISETETIDPKFTRSVQVTNKVNNRTVVGRAYFSKTGPSHFCCKKQQILSFLNQPSLMLKHFIHLDG